MQSTHQSFSYRNTEDDLDMADLIKISSIFCHVCPKESDAYWCFSKFICPSQQESITDQIARLSQLLVNEEHELATYFNTNNIKIEDFCERWLRTRFASCFAESSSLEKLWGKVISISSEFDVLIALAILKLRNKIIVDMDPKQVTHHLRNVKS